MQFLLQRQPVNGQQLALKGATKEVIDCGVYVVENAGAPPSSLASQFQWEVQLERVRDLQDDDLPILVGYYD